MKLDNKGNIEDIYDAEGEKIVLKVIREDDKQK